MRQKLPAKGIVEYEHVRGDKVLVAAVTHNAVTTEGKTHALSRYFDVNTEVGPWYFGLIDNAGFSALSASDTLLSHSGWNEFTNYSTGKQIVNPESGPSFVPARPLWGQGTASAASITNTAKVIFPITGAATLYGLFLTTGGGVGQNVGTLWSTAAFASPLTPAPGDLIRVIYTIQL